VGVAKAGFFICYFLVQSNGVQKINNPNRKQCYKQFKIVM